MGAEEGKAILVNLSLLRDDSPARHGVTLRAIGAHFPLMNVGVTVLAILAHLGEHWLRVASRAFHLFVHSAQWVVGRVVVELEYTANRTPGYC
jgi:energy-converting hydrogenase Eha subunit A